MSLLPYGPEWRYQRKLTHIALNIEAVKKKYHTIQEQHIAHFFNSLIDHLEDFVDQLRLWVPFANPSTLK